MTEQPNDHKQPQPTETQPLLPQQSSSAPAADRPRTVRHHRRALSGRSTRSHLSQISFGPSHNDPSARQVKRDADGRARSRFLQALLVGIALWLVVGLVFGWAGLRRAGWAHGKSRVDYGAKPSVPSSDGRPIRCAEFKTPQSVQDSGSRMPGKTIKTRASFSIALADLDSFFIHGQGSFAKGQISIAASSESHEAQIEVIALTNDEALVDLMTVCHVDQNPDQAQSPAGSHHVGLGIYTPTPEVGPYPDSDLQFRVIVNLPKAISSISQLSIKADLFAVATTNELSGFSFGKVQIITTAGRISIDELVSDQVEIRTSNGYIEGSFTVSRALNLATTNGAIMAKVALALPTKQLDSSSPDSDQTLSARPSVTVDIASMNGAVSVTYVEHPAEMSLFSDVKSTNGRAHVEHAPAYEGDFVVETTWGSADVKGPSKSSKDPTGRARPRQKFIKTNRDEFGFRHISGTVWWGENDAQTREEKSLMGRTLVKTTLGSARATFF